MLVGVARGSDKGSNDWKSLRGDRDQGGLAGIDLKRVEEKRLRVGAAGRIDFQKVDVLSGAFRDDEIGLVSGGSREG